jgi:hypothetical protein
MVRTSNERISADTGHGCCLRRQASIRACQHARKSARFGKHASNDCRTRRKTNVDTDDGHGPSVSFWRTIIRLEIAVYVAL